MDCESHPEVGETIADTAVEKMDQSEETVEGPRAEQSIEESAASKAEMELSEPEVRSNEDMAVDDAKESNEEPMESEGKEEEEAAAADSNEDAPAPTRRLRGRPPRAAATPAKSVAATPATPGKRGRKSVVAATPATPSGRGRKRTNDAAAASTSTIKRGKQVATGLSYEDFITWEAGDRVLSCGEGDQLGHPGRSTTKKPRKVDIVEEDGLKIVQVIAGGVHSAILTSDGVVYSCGINEKGTVPAEGVEPEESTDEFKKIIFSEELQQHGKIVMLTAGASFTAALTDKGSVFAWGNLRDASGKIDVHEQLTAMQKHPIIVIHHKQDLVIVKIAAGENHLVMLSADGRVFTFGDSSLGQCGRSARPGHVRGKYMANENFLQVKVDIKFKPVKFKNIFAGGFWSAFISNNDDIYVCGLNNYDQLGIPMEDKQKEDSGEEKAEGTETEDRELRINRPEVSGALTGQAWTHFDGVQHIATRNGKGEIYCIGKNTDNALGLGSWKSEDKDANWKYETLQKLDIEEAAGVTARLGCSIAWTPSGSAYAWGYDSSGQLGLGLKDDDDRVVSSPEKISSAHLDGYKIVQVSLADNHALFLAVKIE